MSDDESDDGSTRELSPQEEIELSVSREYIPDPPKSEEDSTKTLEPPGDPGNKQSRPPIKIGPSNFLFGATLGEGSFARVVHSRLKSMQRDYAMKILEKSHIKKHRKVNTVLMEKDILVKYSHPMIIKLYYCFTDDLYIYMCMDLAPGGELTNVISKGVRANEALGVQKKACDLATAQFYLSELTEALEYLHANKIVHRDLKPENVLLTAQGHIKLADFGTALIGEDTENSFDGTALYVSPEILNSAPATKSCDIWALGCILYQMLVGVTPFHGDTEYLIFTNITGYVANSFEIEWPDHVSSDAKDIIKAFLHPEPSARLGGGEDDADDEEKSNGYGALKGHSFFREVQWGSILEMQSPYTPDPANFPNSDLLSDGADDDWMLGGEATVIAPSGGARIPALPDSIPDRPSAASSFWNSFLLPTEQQLFTGLTVKRKGLFSKQRQLILTDLPRLFYVDPESKEMKGEVPWDAQHPVQCTIIDEHKFDVLATKTNRVYHLLDKEAGSSVWVDLINAMVEKQAIEHKEMMS